MSDTEKKPEKAKKPAALDFSTAKVYLADPMELAIQGGAELPDAERGPLDTPLDKSHPLFDERLKLKLTKEWIDNIFTHGVREDINIVKLGDKGIPFVVNGRQRVRAARVANTRLAAEGLPPIKVTCKLVRLDDLGMLREMILTNIHTEDSTSTKIAKLKRLLERGTSIEDAAVVFGIRTATAKAWLQYDDTATKAVKAAVDAGKIPHTMGADIARLPADKQDAALAEVMQHAVADKGERPKRSGKAAKAARIIKKHGADNPNESPGIDDKKTMKKFLAAVESIDHGKAGAAALAFWEGVEATLNLILGNETDAKLLKILADLE